MEENEILVKKPTDQASRIIKEIEASPFDLVDQHDLAIKEGLQTRQPWPRYPGADKLGAPSSPKIG